jgi:O-antigen ligase
LTKRKSRSRRAESADGTGTVFRTQWLKRTLAGLAAAAGFLGLLILYIALVGGDPVVKRVELIHQEIETVADEDVDRIDRKKIWQASLELFEEYPIAGAGFGAYSAAITRFDRSGGRFTLEQAHNDYLEIAAGGGLIAVVLTLLFGCLAATFFLRQFRSADKFRRAACFGAALAVIGVMLHSSVEFGLHTPINLLLFLMLIVIGTAQVKEKATRYRISRRRESNKAGG